MNSPTSRPAASRAQAKQSRRFQWSFDHIAALNPAQIDEEELPLQEACQQHDEATKASSQGAIDQFFSQPIIAPSPWKSEASDPKPCDPVTLESPWKVCDTPTENQTPATEMEQSFSNTKARVDKDINSSVYLLSDSEAEDEGNSSNRKRTKFMTGAAFKKSHRTSTGIDKLPSAEISQIKASSTINLIGDQSMWHALPIIDRPHVNDLNCISTNTLRRLMNGEFDSAVHSYLLIDCRYPYEFEGGHIQGAVNIYTQEELTSRLFDELVVKDAVASLEQAKRKICIFYCEYSRERGPRMTRFLRKRDRQLNDQHYPRLYYPEIYLLDGGYRSFYASCQDLCEPQSYRQMHDENHLSELRHFRSKHKSCRLRDESPIEGMLNQLKFD